MIILSKLNNYEEFLIVVIIGFPYFNSKCKDMNKILKTFVIFCLIISQSALIKAQKHIFSQKQLIANGRVWDVAFEDLNNDCSSDLVVANWFKPPTIYYNNSNGDFDSFKSLPCYEAKDSSYRCHGIGINDFNNDKNPDIFVVFNGINNFIYLSDEDEYILTDTVNTNNSDGLNISLGDIDNDNDIDAIVANYKQLAMLWVNDGEGKFAKSDFEFGSSKIINSTALGDINNDGNLDIICSIYRGVIIWLNKGDGTFEKRDQSITYDKGYGVVELADMDNDDDLDIIFSNNDLGASIWINDGKGMFSEIEQKLPKSVHLAIGDLDLNGYADVVCGNSVWLNNGNLQFIQHEEFEIEGRIFGLWLNDIDNDGDLDLFCSTSIIENALTLMKNTTNAH